MSIEQQAQLFQVTPEQQAAYEAQKTRGEVVNKATNSLRRVADVLDRASLNGVEKDGLFRSDLDNAIKHSVQGTKHLRSIKKIMFPTVVKEEKPEAALPL